MILLASFALAPFTAVAVDLPDLGGAAVPGPDERTLDLGSLAAAAAEWLDHGEEASTGPIQVADEGGEVFRTAMPAGDLDGDGRADLLVDETTFDPFTESMARTWVGLSSAGQSLWRQTYSSADGFIDSRVAANADLDGDGADEVLILAVRADQGGGEFVCIEPAACTGVLPLVGEWVLDALRGTDGTLLWTDRQPIIGAFVPSFAFAPPGIGEQLFIQGETNHLYLPAVSGDHDGDGVRDLVVNHVHSVAADNSLTAFTPEGFLGAGAGGEILVTEYVVRSGADGSETLSGILAPGTVPPAVRPTDDLDGDGAPELIAVSPNGVGGGVGFFPFSAPAAHENVFAGPATVVSLLDGRTGAQRWAQVLPSIGAWKTGVHPTGDLDGDGSADLLAYARTAEFTYEYTALSISDGSALWTLAHDGTPLVDDGIALSDDLNGDGRHDVLFLSSLDLFAGGTPRLAVRSGAGGAWLHETTFPLLTEEAFLWRLVPLGDADGDGLLDLLYVENGADPANFESRTGLRLVSGADGTVGWTQMRQAFLDPAAAGTLDGAGADVVLSWQDFGELGTTFYSEGLNGSDGATLWTRAVDDPAIVDERIFALEGDADGDGRDDLILHRFAEVDGIVASQVGLAAGSTGETIWTFP